MVIPCIKSSADHFSLLKGLINVCPLYTTKRHVHPSFANAPSRENTLHMQLHETFGLFLQLSAKCNSSSIA